MRTAFVRLKTHDPIKGHLRERFRMGAACGWGDLLFESGARPMELDIEAAEYLHDTVYQIDGVPSSGKAFDIWYTREELDAAMRKERLFAMGQMMGAPAVEQKPVKPPKPLLAKEASYTPPKVVMLEQDLAAEEHGTASSDLGIATPPPRPSFDEEEEAGGKEVDYADKNITANDDNFGDLEPNADDLAAAAVDTPVKPRRRRVARKKSAAKPPQK